MQLAAISDALAEDLRDMRFAAPISHVYNPLVYARAPHRRYLERFGGAPKEALFLGMNPGPFGMAQTGVPFGDVVLVRDWMGIVESVGKPDPEHPKRPVDGFACTRREVSGSRLWGWARDTFGPPEAFFGRFFVWNYCPLCFMEISGRNFTPDKLPSAERAAINAACDLALRRVVDELRPGRVYGVGVFAEGRAQEALKDAGVPIGRIPHPSPASPAANRGWAEQVTRVLREDGTSLP